MINIYGKDYGKRNIAIALRKSIEKKAINDEAMMTIYCLSLDVDEKCC